MTFTAFDDFGSLDAIKTEELDHDTLQQTNKDIAAAIVGLLKTQNRTKEQNKNLDALRKKSTEIKNTLSARQDAAELAKYEAVMNNNDTPPTPDTKTTLNSDDQPPAPNLNPNLKDVPMILKKTNLAVLAELQKKGVSPEIINAIINPTIISPPPPPTSTSTFTPPLEGGAQPKKFTATLSGDSKGYLEKNMPQENGFSTRCMHVKTGKNYRNLLNPEEMAESLTSIVGFFPAYKHPFVRATNIHFTGGGDYFIERIEGKDYFCNVIFSNPQHLYEFLELVHKLRPEDRTILGMQFDTARLRPGISPPVTMSVITQEQLETLL